MAALAAAGMFLNFVGTLQEGQEANYAAKLEAQQMEAKANEERAVSQRRAIQARRIADRAKSRAKAVAAASGAGATDPTMENIYGDIEDQGTFNVLSELYQGEAKGQGLDFGAKMRRRAGKNALKTSRYRAAGNLLEGGTSLYDRYS